MKLLRILFVLLIGAHTLAAYGRRDIPYTLIEHNMPLAGNSSAMLAVDATLYEATKMYDEGMKKQALFSGLGNSFELLDPRITVNLPSTKPSTSSFIEDFRNVTDLLPTGSPVTTVYGKSRYTRANIHLTKGFEGGLYARLEVPFVQHHVQCTDVSFKGVGATETASLLTKFDAMLAEYELAPLKTNATEQGIGDALLFLGWHGFDKYEDEEVTGLRARIEGGIILPTAREQEHEKVFAPSLGYNRHIGFTGRIEAAIVAWDRLELGGHMNMTAFLTHRTERRVATDTRQKGFIYLHNTTVDEDLGSLWGFGGHLKLKPTDGGFFVTTHYNYSAQSQTSYLILNPSDPVIVGDTSVTPLSFSNAVANAAPDLAGWFHHGVTLSFGYEPKEDHDCAVTAHTRGFVTLPITGSRSFMTLGFGAGVGLEFGMSF